MKIIVPAKPEGRVGKSSIAAHFSFYLAHQAGACCRWTSIRSSRQRLGTAGPERAGARLPLCGQPGFSRLRGWVG
jgi:hypothetical protein